MCRKLIFMLLVFAFGLATSAEAITIIWVSKNKSYSGGDAADQGWVDLLRAQGYTVDYRNEEQGNTGPWQGTLSTGQIAELQAADLIIFSRDDDSDGYNDSRQIWNEVITTPIMNGYGKQVRQSRLNWFAADDEGSPENDMKVIDLGHPIFAGIILDQDNEIDITSEEDAELTDDLTAGGPGYGKILAVRGDGETPHIWIAEWDAGVEFYPGAHTTGGRRMFFAAGTSDGDDGRYFFNADGDKIYLNAVKYLTGAVYVATNPNPKNGPRTAPTGVSGEGHWMAMTFDKGHGATTHTAWFSENFDDVNERNGDVLLGSSPYAPDPNGGCLSNLGREHPRLDKAERMEKQPRSYIVKWTNGGVYKYFVHLSAKSSVIVKTKGWMP